MSKLDEDMRNALALLEAQAVARVGRGQRMEHALNVEYDAENRPSLGGSQALNNAWLDEVHRCITAPGKSMLPHGLSTASP